MTPNTFPVPEGPTFTRSDVSSPGATSNFSFTEAGRYRVSWEARDDDLGYVQLDLRTVVSGTSTSQLTMYTPGYYDIVLPQGGATLNFLVTSLDANRLVQARRVSLTKVG